MPDFKVLLIKEHIDESKNNFDHNIIIIYDSNEDTYYYYGSRNSSFEKNKYKDYNGTFHNTQFSYFMKYLNYLLGKKEELYTLTTELHQLYIKEDEYDYLNFVYLNDQLNNKNTLSAYDYDSVSVTDLEDMLLMIV